MLTRHERFLRSIFDAVAKNSFGTSSSLVHLDCFREGINALGLMGGDVTERDVTLCFSWSRMLLAESQGPGGSKKENCLPFEGFLEALCRIAILKALPTDDEIASAGCADAGAYVARLMHSNAAGYKSLLERKASWGSRPSQPAERCLAHLIAIMSWSVKPPVDPDEGILETITQADVARWNKRNHIQG